MIKYKPELQSNYTIFNRIIDVKNKRSGICDYKVFGGEWVSKGQLLCKIYDLFGNLNEEVVAPEDAFTINSHPDRPVVNTGYLLYHLGLDNIEEKGLDIN